MKEMNTKTITRMAVLMALTTVMTMVIHIPTIGTNGYLNLGDMVVFLAALTLGKKGGFLVGGIGSGLADLLLGYSHYAPITFIVKGLEGYIAGKILETKLGQDKPIIATVVGGLWMAFGYYFAEIFMYGAKAALASVPGNIMQGLLGAVTAIVLFEALKRTKVAS
ncbi:ECF transporter S component [Tissierella pigra]|uniref:ECF transporter S component n=1 Tax=Tissierella pigra TaxID=2607614 RepID=A0A6N7Y234_9FIRM|nr:ECF transporter S component [Tissierella pigra]MBU5425281.1 ECF transporter S component [Tissierella pigra]MSU02080.1 ECF transporter S component [Tissierella pigra]